MFDLIKLRIRHGFQAIPDIRKASVIDTLRGFPLLDEAGCADGCDICKTVCPSEAVSLNPLKLDLGKCIFCGECEKACPSGAVKFTPEHRLGSTSRERLVLTSGISHDDYSASAVEVKKFIKKIFGSSLKLRQVSAGGCSGCETELAASSNVNFDLGRFGIDFVASPRHADGIVITGPITKNMSNALHDAYESVSSPKIVIAVGACAVSGGLFASSSELERKFISDVQVDLFIPGCPPHPLTFINALLDFLDRK